MTCSHPPLSDVLVVNIMLDQHDLASGNSAIRSLINGLAACGDLHFEWGGQGVVTVSYFRLLLLLFLLPLVIWRCWAETTTPNRSET